MKLLDKEEIDGLLCEADHAEKTGEFVHLTPEFTRVLMSRIRQAQTEATAWLVERRDLPTTHWVKMSQGVFLWTGNASEAMKFADRASADQAAEECDLDVHICEHMWPDGF